MNAFVKGIDKAANTRLTENGAKAFQSTKSANLDFFSKTVEYRNDAKKALLDFKDALAENSELALRNLLHLRDIRGGRGERDAARTCLLALRSSIFLQTNLLRKMVEVGRWDDLLFVFQNSNDEKVRRLIAAMIHGAIESGDGLAAKWTPRKGQNAVDLRTYWEMSPRAYRKFLVAATNVVETKMCDGKWKDIEYSHVPSQAARIYKGAFRRHDEKGYAQFLKKVESGETEIKAATLYPHQLVTGIIDQTAEAQWKALPDWVPEGVSFFPMIDVSGSMGTEVAKGVMAMDVSVALGLYLSERNKSAFKGRFLTFETSPRMMDVSRISTLAKKIQQIRSAPWGGSTDVDRAFRKILEIAKNNNVSQEDMPDYFIILSDMQFNGYGNQTNFSTAKGMFKEAGYKLPTLVFWNLCGRDAALPVTKDKSGAILVSGFSPSLMKGFLSGKASPYDFMLEELMSERYKLETLNPEL